MKRLSIAIAAATLAIYAGVIAIGIHLSSIYPTTPTRTPWHPDSISMLSPDRQSAIQLGARLFNETPVYASTYTKSRISCSNCHLQGGIAPFSAPVVGSTQAYPVFSKRAGRKITLEDRIQECMTRSENGDALPHDSAEMHALLAYINWLSEPHRTQRPFTGRGLEPLPQLTPNPTHGAEIYAVQCAGCHGVNGEGARRPFPPLWGPNAFNDGAGMSGVDKMAAFVQYNMPHNRKGILSAQDAYDVAAFVHAQPRPAFNHAYDKF